MRKFAVLVCLALLPLGCEVASHEEATYEGLSTSDWIEKLTDEDVNERRGAAQVLGELGITEAEQTIPALRDAVADPDKQVRLYALQSLEKLAPKAGPAQGAVGRAMNDKDKKIVKQAVRTYKKIELSKPSALNRN